MKNQRIRGPVPVSCILPESWLSAPGRDSLGARAGTLVFAVGDSAGTTAIGEAYVIRANRAPRPNRLRSDRPLSRDFEDTWGWARPSKAAAWSHVPNDHILGSVQPLL